MHNSLNIALEAHNDERDHHRRYEVIVERDLLGDWLVVIRFGRVGGGTNECRFGFSSIEAAQRLVREHLRRRMSAPRRIGCKYEVRSLAAPKAALNEWVPNELLPVGYAAEPLPPVPVGLAVPLGVPVSGLNPTRSAR